MDAIGADSCRQIHDGAHVQEALHGPGDEMRLVGFFHVDRRGVTLGIDRDGPDAEFPARPDDPHGDLTAIGD